VTVFWVLSDKLGLHHPLLSTVINELGFHHPRKKERREKRGEKRVGRKQYSPIIGLPSIFFKRIKKLPERKSPTLSSALFIVFGLYLVL